MKSSLLSWAATIGVAVAVVIFVHLFIGRVVTVNGPSMLPSYEHGDRLFTTKLYGDLHYNDVVVIHRENDTDIIKRIIAIEGDTIDIDFFTGDVFVNGNLIDEPFINEPTLTPIDFNGPVTVPKDHVFVMGDNRNRSDDSRDSLIGFVSKKQIFGKAILRFYPFDRFGVPI